MSILFVVHTPGGDYISIVLFSHMAGHSAPCISLSALHLHYVQTVSRINIQSRSAPISVRRIRVADVAARIAIPHVVRIVAIRRTAETVLRFAAYSPYFSL